MIYTAVGDAIYFPPFFLAIYYISTNRKQNQPQNARCFSVVSTFLLLLDNIKTSEVIHHISHKTLHKSNKIRMYLNYTLTPSLSFHIL